MQKSPCLKWHRDHNNIMIRIYIHKDISYASRQSNRYYIMVVSIYFRKSMDKTSP